MMIRNMFAENINRPINGVIKVDQSGDDVIEQELREYVITRELKRHFVSFFNYYSDAFDVPTADIGVWISGFFGSGKSHFLKMLSYLLKNEEIKGIRSVERFREKLADDPATFRMIQRSTQCKTETILFNIDIEGPINKDKTAVLRVFAKMFFNHLGFYGENLKVAMLEYYIHKEGKTQQFRDAFARHKGKPWVEMRRVFAFNKNAIIPSLMEVLGMSEADAEAWFSDKSEMPLSIAQLVQDINDYVSRKPEDFRLLFMIDEVGQYVGTDKDLLLNLQSIVEKIGSECGGKVWVMCTGQEAIDEIIKVRDDEFSRIQARFKTRLSLSSSSVDEVIQKRILKKKPDVAEELQTLYHQNEAVLRNLFTFTESVADIKGYSDAGEYSENYPFVPYQFIIMQKVFAEIRKHGNSGKHLSGGERSMLSGFQEAAQKIQEQDEYALVPFFRFYDTVHTFLDSTIRRVIERCAKAAEQGSGVEPMDVDTLKLLYLIRYIDDIPSTLDNIVILMANDIRIDKIVMRESVRASLERLFNENYINRTGDTWHFLTDEEQDIQREINNTHVDTSAIVERIAQLLSGDIYPTRKYRHGEYNFAFDLYVDDYAGRAGTGGMVLRFLTLATEPERKSHQYLMVESKRREAIIVLGENPYYTSLERAMKIRRYVNHRNVSQLAKSVQNIIQNQLDLAKTFEDSAMEGLKKAIVEGRFYADGEHLTIRGSDAKAKIDQALEYLVSHVYSELSLINQNYKSDADILAILSGAEQGIAGMESNRDAAAKVEEYLQMQHKRRLPTSMADVHTRYSGIPYGWLEIDIAAVVATLIRDQKVTIRYAGNTIQPNNTKLPDMLRKKTEIGRTSISIREVYPAGKMKQLRAFLREYFNIMDVPADEDSLVEFIVEKFTEQQTHFNDLNARYNGKRYPDRKIVQSAMSMVADILFQKKDNIALFDRIVSKRDDLLDLKEDLVPVESFFQSQVSIFDAATKMEEDLRRELDYLAEDPSANDALNQIRLVVRVDGGFSYKKIPLIQDWMEIVRQGHNRLLAEKRRELRDVANQCYGAVTQVAPGNRDVQDLVEQAGAYCTRKLGEIDETNSLALLDGMVMPMIQFKDHLVSRIQARLRPVEPPKPPKPDKPLPPEVKAKNIRNFNRGIIFTARTLESEAEIDEYLAEAKKSLMYILSTCDGVKLN